MRQQADTFEKLKQFAINSMALLKNKNDPSHS